mmetsp:Transcript_102315/g.289303  ORF Transcript_102315/g.289303 Transcript_102315/m.289303 type:complete len:213 (+) Transcript_102315:1132-1770(+)
MPWASGHAFSDDANCLFAAFWMRALQVADLSLTAQVVSQPLAVFAQPCPVEAQHQTLLLGGHCLSQSDRPASQSCGAAVAFGGPLPKRLQHQSRCSGDHAAAGSSSQCAQLKGASVADARPGALEVLSAPRTAVPRLSSLSGISACSRAAPRPSEADIQRSHPPITASATRANTTRPTHALQHTAPRLVQHDPCLRVSSSLSKLPHPSPTKL